MEPYFSKLGNREAISPEYDFVICRKHVTRVQVVGKLKCMAYYTRV